MNQSKDFETIFLEGFLHSLLVSILKMIEIILKFQVTKQPLENDFESTIIITPVTQ